MQIFKLQAYHPGVCDLDLLQELQHKFINVNTLRPSRKLRDSFDIMKCLNTLFVQLSTEQLRVER